MVRIAVVGGTGNVATELLPTVVASGKHDITIFTRGKTPDNAISGVSFKTVNYNDRSNLTEALDGFEVCLSFLVPTADVDSAIQKNLVHACIDAGVRRFAPSQWSIKNNFGHAMFKPRDDVAAYLAELNKENVLLEYCLFQPSIFMDYLGHPFPLSHGLHTWPYLLDLENRKAIVLDDGNQPVVFTAAKDIAGILTLALDDNRPWPVIGGMRGTRTTYNELIALGKELRPGPWTVNYVKGDDVENGVLNSSWVPTMMHPHIPEEQREAFSIELTLVQLKALRRGAWDVSDEWNKRFPEYEFISVEDYLRKVWEGRS